MMPFRGRSRRVVGWVGGIIATATTLVLVLYLASAGLDKADKLASVLGLFIGLAGLAAAIYSLAGNRSSSDTPHLRDSAHPTTSDASAGDVHNTISGGTVRGTLIQGRDFSGPLTLGTPPPPSPPESDSSP